MRVLVTGAGGFVGGYLTRQLEILGHEVDAPSKLELDVTSAKDVQRRIGLFQPDTVVHLAAVTNRPSTEDDAEHMRRVNILGAATVARHSKGCHLVLTSTCHVYGAPRALPITEEHPLLGRGDYAESKIEAELAVLEVAQERTTILRLFNLVGPGQSRAFALAGWCWDACEGEARSGSATGFTLEVGDLTLARDYLDVRDAVEAICTVVDGGLALGGQTLNICSGQSTRLEKLFAMCAPSATAEVAENRLRSGDVMEIVGCNLAIRALGWKPKRPLSASIVDTRRWIQDHLS